MLSMLLQEIGFRIGRVENYDKNVLKSSVLLFYCQKEGAMDAEGIMLLLDGAVH
jgi:hypothetical protein